MSSSLERQNMSLVRSEYEMMKLHKETSVCIMNLKEKDTIQKMRRKSKINISMLMTVRYNESDESDSESENDSDSDVFLWVENLQKENEELKKEIKNLRILNVKRVSK